MGFKGRGDDDILSRRQAKSFRHFPQVDVSLAFGFGGRVQEEVLLQVLILPAHLETDREKFHSGESHCTKAERLSAPASPCRFMSRLLLDICAVSLPFIWTVCW